MRDRIGPTRSRTARLQPLSPRRGPGGFSLVEALVSLVVLAMAGAALLLAAQTSTSAGDDSIERTIASGVANQVIDEILGLPFHEPGGTWRNWPLGPEAGELSLPPQRARFDDVDDYHQYVAEPLVDPWHIPLGSGDGQGNWRYERLRAPEHFFEGWSLKVEVRYADPANLAADLPNGITGPYRSVTVTIHRAAEGAARELARIRRVIGYVPATI